MKIRFDITGFTLEFNSHVSYPLRQPTNSPQIISNNASGDLIIENLSYTPRKSHILIFNRLTENDYYGLENWVKNIVNWAATPFDYTDTAGDTVLVRYVGTVFDFEQYRFGLYRGEIELREEYT